MRLTRDLRHLSFALCLGIPLLVLLLVIGSMALLSTYERQDLGTYERPESFVCMSDVAGTLLLCERSYGAPLTTETVLWIAGSMKS